MNELVDQYGAPRAARAGTGEPLSALREFIANGGYRPGDRLPPERELTNRLGLTRTNLRKALDTLERDGAIWRHVGKGTFVSGPVNGASGARPSDLSQIVSPLQMMRARLSLEPAVAREAAINASENGVARIIAAKDAAVAAESWDDYEAFDDAFHRAIAEATENALLLALFDQLNRVRRAVAWDTVVRSSDRPPRDHRSFAEHQDIAAAIKARNASQAHAAMRGHLASVSSRLFGDV